MVIACSEGGTSIEDLAERSPPPPLARSSATSCCASCCAPRRPQADPRAADGSNPEAIIKEPIDPVAGMTDANASRIVKGLKVSGCETAAADQIKALYKVRAQARNTREFFISTIYQPRITRAFSKSTI